MAKAAYLDPKHDLPASHPRASLLDAASLLCALLRTAKVQTLAQLVENDAWPARLVLSPDQARTLATHATEFSRLYQPVTGDPYGAVLPVVCPTCLEVSWASTSTVPARCTLTAGCDGRPLRPRPAVRRPAA